FSIEHVSSYRRAIQLDETSYSPTFFMDTPCDQFLADTGFSVDEYGSTGASHGPRVIENSSKHVTRKDDCGLFMFGNRNMIAVALLDPLDIGSQFDGRLIPPLRILFQALRDDAAECLGHSRIEFIHCRRIVPRNRGQ